MFERRYLWVILLCVLCLVASSSAKIVSVTLAHATSGSPGRMELTDLAGAPGARVANWNNLTNTNRTLGDDESVVYDDGMTVDGIGISIDTPRNWSNRDNNSSYQNDQIMYNGVIDCFNDTTTLTLTGVPFAQYDVYFYMRDDGANRAGSFTLAGGPTYYLRGTTGNPTANGEGYVLSSDVTMTAGDNASIDPGNYAVFEGLSGDNVFEITAVNAGDGTMRNKWAGFQIVGTANPLSATKPSPSDGATDVQRDAALSWTGSQYAGTHDVYFSTHFDDVNLANPDALVSPGQDANAYDPGILDFDQTYYWRIDEVNGAPDFDIHEGQVWSFATEPVSYLVESVAVSANVDAKADSEIENIVDGSGLLEDGGHSTADGDMWSSAQGPTDANIVIDFAFDKAYRLDKALVWNYNNGFEYIINAGVKDITIEYSTDGTNWSVLGDAVVTQGTSTPATMAQPIDMNGVTAQYVRFLVKSNYGRSNQVGLSEVRFYFIPTWAREPQPESGADGVDPGVVLSWRPGREAVTHEVHLGTDANAVAAGEALVDVVDVASYAPVGLTLGQELFWMITEVNEATTPSAWPGDVWNFSTPDFITVDDMESYNDAEGKRIFEIWIDGYGVNSNGSLVGHDTEPFAEETIVHSGDQSMPFRYGENGATTSEATMTLETPEDWTLGSANTLVVWFRGQLGNATGQLYAKINGGAPINYTGSAASLAAPVWKQWNIPLGAAAGNVTSLTLGVSGAGRGQLYFDDIGLYSDAPPQTGNAVDPGTNALAAYYPMSDNASDASGNGRNGTAFTGVNFGTGPAGYGRAIVLDGVSGYVELPIGPVVQSSDSMTVAAWVNRTATAAWQRIFDFGTGTDVYMFLTNSNGSAMRFAITTGSGAGESQLTADGVLPSGWHHVAVTIDEATGAMALYLDGSAADTGATDTLPSALGNTTQNWIGQSQYADPFFAGSIDEFRIYTRALSAEEVQYLAGDR